MKLFKCQHCGQLLYFENDLCVKCSHRLGFIPEIMNLSALEVEGDAQQGTWRALAIDNKLYRFCANASFGVCNWMVDAGSSDIYCAACKHNRTVPDTGIADNVVAWRKIEVAKHTLFYTLMKLHLPLEEKDENGNLRLCFDFLASPRHSEGPRVLTGHDNGLITLALEEANDAEREKRRTTMHEPYRTLVGHFRHEVGHYYWDVLVRDGGLIEPFRAVFGDETADYAAALQAYYANGAPPNWQDNFISAYATSHPWEDFAETWAHYLHITGTLATIADSGLVVEADRVKWDLSHDVDARESYADGTIEDIMSDWLVLAGVLNRVNNSMGRDDLYPFTIHPHVVAKLGFIHRVVTGAQN